MIIVELSYRPLGRNKTQLGFRLSSTKNRGPPRFCGTISNPIGADAGRIKYEGSVVHVPVKDSPKFGNSFAVLNSVKTLLGNALASTYLIGAVDSKTINLCNMSARVA